MSDQKLLKELFADIIKSAFVAGDSIDITENRISVRTPISTRHGGTGTASLTGYVMGNGDLALTATATIPAKDIEGILSVSQGGTGTDNLSGYLRGNGNQPVTGVTTIPASDITGLGSMSAQDANSVKITGGSIDSSVINGDIKGNSVSINTVLPVEKGGTGVTSKDAIKTTLGYADSGANSDITSLSGLKTPLSVKQGGTGGTGIFGYVKGTGDAFVGLETINSADIKGDITGNAENVNGVVDVSHGGTGASELTGYLIGNGTKSVSGVKKIPGSDIDGDIDGSAKSIRGVLAVNQGGTGMTSVKGFLCGDGKKLMAVETIGHDSVDGLGDMALQDADHVNITGGQASLERVTAQEVFYNGKTHRTATMTGNMPLMEPVGFIEITIGNHIRKIPYYEF